MNHLFTTEPLPVPVGYVPMRRAMVCCEDDCGVIFVAGPACPNCGSARMMPLEKWLGRPC